ncbi:MAG: hypothetical protein DLM55_03195 [Acidimicrobiales bacterium]|nr:MAG: hypothetical protein DLM55_03195 [Acidimicrobiales bacterium]
MKKMVVVVSILVLGLAPAMVAHAESTPEVSVQGSDDIAHTYLKLDGQSGRSTPPPVPAAPSDIVVKTRPTCGDKATAEGGDCPPRPCGHGDREYLQITETSAGEFRDYNVTCGLPDSSPQSLAIKEFYSTQVKISSPTIAPETTTFANFPNIYWSDVKTYEQATGIKTANVRLKFIPVSYRWNFGDGKSMTTSDPGKLWNPELTTIMSDIEKNYAHTHRYANTGTFDTTLTVIFNGQYSVAGGPWADIAGSIQATSPPHPLLVREARGQLIKPSN